jgi:hypothetical protein
MHRGGGDDMRTHTLLILFLAGCGATNVGSNNNDINAKDQACATHSDAQSCGSDGANECSWIAYGHACPATGPCAAGVCQGPIAGGGTLTQDGGTVCAQPATTACQQFMDQSSCLADVADQCHWYALGIPCQVGQPCKSGVCQGPPPPPGCSDGGSGSGVGVGCACPNGGVCVQLDNGAIQCQTPIGGCLGGPSACGCLEPSDGTCAPSPDVTGLCVCKSPVPSGCNCAPGEACIEQIGGPATQTPPQEMCVKLTPGCLGGVSACSCIPNQGTCMPSQTQAGLCICDNGIR